MERAEQNESWTQLQALVTIAGGLVGAAAYVYLLGGLVVWLKLKAAQLPTDDAMQVLDRNRLLAVGIKALLFEAFVLAALLGLAMLTWKWVRDAKRGSPQYPAEPNNKWKAWKIFLHGAISATLASALITKGLAVTELHPSLGLGKADLSFLLIAIPSIIFGVSWAFWIVPWIVRKWDLENPEHAWRRWWVKTILTVAAISIAAVFLAAPAGVLVLVLLLFLHLSHMLQNLVDVNNPMTLMPAVLGMGVAVSVVVAVYIATPPVSLDRATVYLEDGTIVRGGYVGQSGEGVFLADCNADPVDPTVSSHVKLRIVLLDQVRRIKLGGSPFIVDYGDDPSLLDFGRYIFSRNFDEWTNTMSLDVRDPKLVCGRRHSLDILTSTSPTRPISALQIKVLGGGTLELFGDHFETEVEEPKEASRETLAVEPDAETRAEYRCGGMIHGKVTIKLTVARGFSEERHTSVTRQMKARGGQQCRRRFLYQASEVNAR
ncbi:MAG TPA: hypothetical protein VFN18_07375 [Solirubrobacterales bacterium]|nr:hypothetical protein [Solirubrobacterales bacterium]